MIEIAHLLDDFGMGGVTRALTLFDQPKLKQLATSNSIPIQPAARSAPKLKADLIINHMALSWARIPFLFSLRARNPKARIVHIEHNYTRAFEERKVPSKARFRRMIRIASLLVNEVVCVSNAQYVWLSKQVGISKSKMRVIYPWTDRFELFSVSEPTYRGDEPLGLLAYGRYAEVKNFAELIAAMRSFSPSEVHLTVIGDGPQRSQLQALAEDIPNVDVLGPTDNPRALLEQSDAVIVPSRYEAFGLVATEARMAGRAILVANVDGLPEQANKGGLAVSMVSASQIMKAIRLARTSDLVQMGKAGRQSVIGFHENILSQWRDLIHQSGLALD